MLHFTSIDVANGMGNGRIMKSDIFISVILYKMTFNDSKRFKCYENALSYLQPMNNDSGLFSRQKRYFS